MRATSAKTFHTERHNVARIGWLRAAVLGANDGIVSTASLIVGVAAAGGAVGLLRRDDEPYTPNPCSFHLLNLAIDVSACLPAIEPYSG